MGYLALKICRLPIKLAIAANEVHFCDCCRNMGYFLCGVKRIKRFTNVHLHCVANNLKRTSKMSPPRKYADAHG